jgi:hypothetical protein
MLVALAVSEVTLRVLVGLGDPPLLIPDGEIGYVNRPGQYSRFGNDIEYNSFSMRCEPVASKAPGELRILVCGDSIVHGTARVSQADLATAIAQRRVAGILKRRVSVLNISACGWSPRNVLAYLTRYGVFNADLAILVFNGEDLLETVGPTGRVYPTAAPLFALQEVLQIGAIRWCDRSREASLIQRSSSVPSIEAIIALIQGKQMDVEVVFHPTAAEALEEGENRWCELLAECASGLSVKCVSLRDYYLEGFRGGATPWMADGVHLTARGQAILGEALVREILQQAKVR